MSAGAPDGLAALRARIVGVDQPVPLFDGSLRPYVNLDNAASTPVLREVLDTVVRFMSWCSSVHRGSGFKSRVASQAYEDAREIVARFVGARPDQHTVIFGKNATEAINKLSHRLQLDPADVVLVSLLEHHSNDLPWRARAHVVHISVDAQGRLDEDHFDQLLRRHAGRVRLVAMTGGSNVTGFMPDVHRLAVKAHAAGAQILVDAAQRAPHRSIDMRALDDPAHLDYVALSAHKLYAPFGCGALIGRRDTFEQGEPEYRGGGTVDFVGTDAVAWAPAPERDEAGTPNVVGAVALAAALQALQEIGIPAIARHEAELTAHALRRLAQVPGAVRVSFGLYNTQAEVDILVEALRRAANGEIHGRYLQDAATGDYRVDGEPPDIAACFPMSARHGRPAPAIKRTAWPATLEETLS